ncbi:MAG: hypothetical protein AAF799_40370 [Myxococcota bacterium]
MPSLRLPLTVALASSASACLDLGSGTDDPEQATDTDTDAADSSSSHDATGITPDDDGADSTGAETPPPADAGPALLRRLPGLWVAPVTSMTSVGNFPIMAMDIRPADDRTLFSRVDLDADNNLRFAFAIEDVDGEPTLVFRNGGEFLGILRDTRTRLVEHDPDAETWRFCAITGGCGYVEATIELSDDQLTLAADVLSRPHMFWEGQLAEERPTDGDFPYDPSPGQSDDPFPAMPTLRATLSWLEPLTEPADAWILLSATECGLAPGSCTPSRFIHAFAAAGSTSIELSLEQIHPGDYSANAVLDRNGNLAASLLPDSGDLVSLPNQPVTVADLGESSASLMLLVEL